MKLELKNIQVCKWASEETHCYQAVVYVNGKPAIEVSNEGHGGEDNQDPIETSKKDIVGEVNTWCENNLPKWKASDGEMIPTSLAIWCCDEVNKHLVQKAHKSSFNRNIKKKIMYIENDKLEGVYFKNTNVLTEKHFEFFKKKYPHRKPLNFMPKQKAFELYAKYMDKV